MVEADARAKAEATVQAVRSRLLGSPVLSREGKDFTAIELVGSGIDDWRVRVCWEDRRHGRSFEQEFLIFEGGIAGDTMFVEDVWLEVLEV